MSGRPAGYRPGRAPTTDTTADTIPNDTMDDRCRDDRPAPWSRRAAGADGKRVHAGTVTAMADKVVSVSRVIKASPEAIFDLLADPARHAEIDGSGMVQESRGESMRLALGSKLGMDMKMGP